MKTTSTTSPVLRCQIDHRSSDTPTQADRTGATLLGKADWQERRGTSHRQGDAAGLAGSLSGRKGCNCRSRSDNAKDRRSSARSWLFAAVFTSFLVSCMDDYSIFEGTPDESDAFTSDAPRTSDAPSDIDGASDAPRNDVNLGDSLDSNDGAAADLSVVDAIPDQSTDVVDGGRDAWQGGRDAEAGAACGATSQPCCNGGICGAGNVCNAGTCRACGGPGQACCSNTCAGGGCCSSGICLASGDDGPNAGTVCSDGSIVSCGGTAQPCCARNTCSTSRCCVGGRCIASGNSCGSTLGTCNTNRCTGGTPPSCGTSGLACCPGNPNGAGNASDFCTQTGTACDPGSGVGCRNCGGTGQPCCDGQVCLSGGCCDASSHQCIQIGANCPGAQGVCLLGGCQSGACGRLGAPCCGGGVSCTAPSSTCSNGTCVACGGSGQPCCPPNRGSGGYCGEPFVCQTGTNRCVACGATSNACCAGSVCTMTACGATNVCQ